MNDKIKLLSLNQVKKGVEKLLKDEEWTSLKAEANPDMFMKRFDKVFGKHLKQLPYLIQFLNVKSVPFKIYRIRKVSRQFNEHLISTHGAPTSDICNHYQRANIPNYPVFYGSDNPGTAIAEVLQQNTVNSEDEYVLSEWSFRESSQIRICPFIFSNSETEWMNSYASSAIHEIKTSVLQSHTAEEQEGFIEVLRFLSELFLTETSRPITGHLAHINLYANHSLRAEVFLYPSVQMRRRTVNFAIHPNCISEKARLENVYKVKLNTIDREEGTFKISFISAGENKDGIIHWYEIDRNGRSDHNGLKALISQTRELL